MTKEMLLESAAKLVQAAEAVASEFDEKQIRLADREHPGFCINY